MGLEYSRTQFGETYSQAYLEVSEYVINSDDTGYFEFIVYDTDSKTHLLAVESVNPFTWDTISTTNTAEDQAYAYITGSMTEYSSAL